MVPSERLRILSANAGSTSPAQAGERPRSWPAAAGSPHPSSRARPDEIEAAARLFPIAIIEFGEVGGSTDGVADEIGRKPAIGRRSSSPVSTSRAAKLMTCMMTNRRSP
jgi:hypothetical protein